MNAHPAQLPSAGHMPLGDAPLGLRRQVLGLRVDAVIEISALLAVITVIDLLWGQGDRFSHVSPHPFWVVVLLAASYYGTREGLAAAVLSSAVLLVGQVPHDNSALRLQEWPFRVTLQLLAWGIAALIFGEIRDAWRRRTETMREELDELREHTRAITQAHHRLQRDKEHLESRVAGQLCTVHAMFNASRAIEKQGVGDVLMGVGELVRRVLAPEKFSLYLLNGSHLEATISEGWKPDDTFARELDESSPLYHAIVFDRRYLAVVQAADEPILRGEGILAGPVADSVTGEIVGMLKIEGISFLELHPSSVQNFRILCEWIGSALANARQVESLRLKPADGSVGRLHSVAEFAADRELFRSLAARVGLLGRVIHLAFDSPDANHPAGTARLSRIVATVAQRVLDRHERCYECADGAWPYAVILPGCTPDAAQAVAQRFAARLAAAVGEGRPQPVVRHRIEPI